MPERLQLTRPVMRATAGLHPNQARREICEETRHLRTLKLLSEQHLALLVHTVDLKHVLCHVDAYRSNLHVGRPPSVSGEYPSPLWHIDAVGAGASIPLVAACTVRLRDAFQRPEPNNAAPGRPRSSGGSCRHSPESQACAPCYSDRGIR